MDVLQHALDYALNPSHDFLPALRTHLLLSAIALAVALLIGVPLGIAVSRSPGLARVVLNLAGLLRVLPSVALLFLLLPSQGIGFRPAAIALAVLAIPPLLINTDAGLRSVDPAIREAAQGMGMSAIQRLRRVELPLALPVMLAGLRIATVEVVASATLATLIGGGGLGDFIAAGLALSRPDILLVGALPVAALALLAELLLTGGQRLAARRQVGGA
jgi:osmoprotectant transport system permease protein